MANVSLSPVVRPARNLWHNAPLWMHCVVVATAALLATGFLTPVAGLLAGVQFALIVMRRAPTCSGAIFDSPMSLVFGVTILLAVIGSGPGAYSLDARLFGRREIIIPKRSFEPPESP